jgi:hypothetical protein
VRSVCCALGRAHARNCRLSQDRLDDFVGRHALDFRIRLKNEAMPQDASRVSLDVVWNDEVSPLNGGFDPRGFEQRDRRPRRGSDLDRPMMACIAHQGCDVVDDLVVDTSCVHGLLHLGHELWAGDL